MYCNFRLQDWKSSNKVFLQQIRKIFQNYQRCFILVQSTSQAKETDLNPHPQKRRSDVFCSKVNLRVAPKINVNQSKLLGAIVLLIFHPSCIIRGLMETITIDLFVKRNNWFPNHLHRNSNHETLTAQCRGRSR